jgi:hypothetical protein
MSETSLLLREAFEGELTTVAPIQLAAGLSLPAAAAFCMVSPETFRRWRSDRVPNRTALRLLAIKAGLVPWTGWEGWEVHGGLLFPPGISRGGISPGELLAAPILRQLLSEQRRLLEQLVRRDGPSRPARRRGRPPGSTSGTRSVEQLR